MLKHKRLEHRFVESFPDQLDPGVLYISMEFASATHSCCCGCGEEIVTPFSPTDWKMMFDGESVSLWPSIGNWNLKCRSHYIIECSKIHEAEPWSEKQISAERRRDQAAKAQYYGTDDKITPIEIAPLVPQVPSQPQVPQQVVEEKLGRWARLRNWFGSFFG